MAERVQVRDHRDHRDHRDYEVRDHRRDRVRDHRTEAPPRHAAPSRTRRTDENAYDRARADVDADNRTLNRTIDNVLGDPGLSFEDRLQFILLAIVQHMDKKIDRQAKKVADLQTQQDKNPNATEGKSIDLEVQELDRLMKKRDQLFKMFESIINKLTSSTDQVLQKMQQG